MVRLRRFVGYAANRLRYESLPANAWFIARKALLPVGRVGLYFIYRKELTVPPEAAHAKVPVEVKLASLAECEEAARLDGGDEAYRQRLLAWWGQGHKCFVAKAGSSVVAVAWLGFEEMRQLSFSVLLDADEAYLTGAHTANAWRGKGIHSELEHRRLAYAREAGYRTVYVAVSADNGRSGRSFRRRGWELSGIVLHFGRAGASTARGWCLRGSAHPVRLVGTAES
jgi:GNAT superfamily N-acetyltransferase